MLRYISSRIGETIATMFVVSLIVYGLLEFDEGNVAAKALGQFSTPEQRQLWLTENGYDAPFVTRYAHWLWNFVSGDWGTSLYFNKPVLDLLPNRLAATGLLAATTFLALIVLGLGFGILAGAREGSLADRIISFFCVLTTSIPVYAGAVFLSAIFVYWLGLLPGASAMTAGFSWREIVLPTATLVLYSAGYVARVTRASMAEAMTSPYVRTALLKGASPARIVLNHALRNALIAPITVLMLHASWLLSGVIVVEMFFGYKGFGTLTYQASISSDINLIEACTMVGVAVVVLGQIVADSLYAAVNSRLRLQIEPSSAHEKFSPEAAL